MDPFNIKIIYQDESLTLTILPEEDDYYKIIYFGGVVGALRMDKHGWNLMEKNDVAIGDLPWYSDKADLNDRLPMLVLDSDSVSQIVEAIENQVNI